MNRILKSGNCKQLNQSKILCRDKYFFNNFYSLSLLMHYGKFIHENADVGSVQNMYFCNLKYNT